MYEILRFFSVLATNIPEAKCTQTVLKKQVVKMGRLVVSDEMFQRMSLQYEKLSHAYVVMENDQVYYFNLFKLGGQ